MEENREESAATSRRGMPGGAPRKKVVKSGIGGSIASCQEPSNGCISYPHGRACMEHQLATALAELTTGIYVLTVRVDECQHGMSSSWVTQVSGAPVLIMAAVDQQHVTHQMVVQSGVFALNIVGTQSKHLEDYFYSAQSR